MADRSAGVPPHHVAPGAAPATANNGPLNGPARTVPRAQTKTGAAAQQPETKDSLREIVETVVFVVVLVLMLKSFVAEAFVIPTGSMAETLYGYQKMVTCPKCGHYFPVNCSQEVDPTQGPPIPVTACICPNCRHFIDFATDGIHPSSTTGDRVLVAKFLYDLGLGGLDRPKRYQVVVFKYPEEPQRLYTPLNYIKRLIGLPRETIAIRYGKLYVYQGPELQYDDQDRDVPRLELWRRNLPKGGYEATQDHMRTDDPKAIELFHEGKFNILVKPPDQVMAERRLVYDNDHQATDLIGKVPPRWEVTGAWTADKSAEPRTFQCSADQGTQLSWLHYHHRIPEDDRPLMGGLPRGRNGAPHDELITDFMGYNTWVPHPPPAQNWVGDLMEEFDVDIAKPQGELVLELSKGVDRFQAAWDLSTGICTLKRITGGRKTVLASKETALKKPGKHTLRFANVDERLLVWVDKTLPFADDGVNYLPPKQRGPTEENDLRAPASIGVHGADLKVSHLKLWRDTYYTSLSDSSVGVNFGDPKDWEAALRDLPVRTYYVQPDHFLCLGDNSPESSDGRSWGLVPKRLLLGRAMFIYYPLQRVRAIE
jgi:signal peptidase I